MFASYKDHYFGTDIDIASFKRLCLTCQRFHDIIIHDPRFWSSIYVRENTRITERRLSLAKSRPLDVSIESLHWSEMDLVIKKRHQWRSLKLCLNDYVFQDFECYPVLDFEAVIDLDLRLFDDCLEHGTIEAFYRTCSFRNLKALTLFGDNWQGLPPANSFPRLEDLTLSEVSLGEQDVAIFLQTTPALRNLMILH